MKNKSDRSVGIWFAAVIAVLFGLLTVKSGGSVLFVDGMAREDAGNYVPFVLWFNFLAGFAYLLTGAGLFRRRRWAARLSVVVAIATLAVFALLGLHISNEGLYEARTVAAMALRAVVWVGIATFSYRNILHP